MSDIAPSSLRILQLTRDWNEASMILFKLALSEKCGSAFDHAARDNQESIMLAWQADLLGNLCKLPARDQRDITAKINILSQLLAEDLITAESQAGALMASLLSDVRRIMKTVCPR